MKTKVVRHAKCEMCGEIVSYIVRDTNVNSDLKEKDIYKLKVHHLENLYNIKHCETCDCETTQMTVGWKY